jgi:Tfp pilus assembly protein PilE
VHLTNVTLCDHSVVVVVLSILSNCVRISAVNSYSSSLLLSMSDMFKALMMLLISSSESFLVMSLAPISRIDSWGSSKNSNKSLWLKLICKK